MRNIRPVRGIGVPTILLLLLLGVRTLPMASAGLHASLGKSGEPVCARDADAHSYAQERELRRSQTDYHGLALWRMIQLICLADERGRLEAMYQIRG